MDKQKFRNGVKLIYRLLFVFCGLILLGSGGLVYKMINPSFLTFDKKKVNEGYVNKNSLEFGKIENGIHLATGFKDDNGLQQVITNCTPCHSAKLVTQNRANKEGWLGIIRWMQETQNLWDLGENESVIVNYLAKNYAPEEKGRREVLQNIEWYNLKE